MSPKPKRTQGFTLIELLVVIAIISLLSSVIFASVRSATERARGARIAADLRNISLAWTLWKSDVSADFRHEDLYGLVNPDAPCNDEPPIDDSDLMSNVSSLPGWGGPYFTVSPKDPWGRRYSYDNDNDLWSAANKWGGVNIQLEWCAGEAGRYTAVASRIDKVMDNGDGADLGRFRWDTGSSGGLGFLVAPYYQE